MSILKFAKQYILNHTQAAPSEESELGGKTVCNSIVYVICKILLAIDVDVLVLVPVSSTPLLLLLKVVLMRQHDLIQILLGQLQLVLDVLQHFLLFLDDFLQVLIFLHLADCSPQICHVDLQRPNMLAKGGLVHP